MLARNRTFSVLTSIGYVLTITASVLFHNHGGNIGNSGGCACRTAAVKESPASCRNGHEEGRPSPRSPAHRSIDGDCPVCQFLAQNPAPADDVPPPTFESMPEEVAAPAPARVASGAFTAWRSRAPPSVA